jgi:hypothetical protein
MRKNKKLAYDLICKLVNNQTTADEALSHPFFKCPLDIDDILQRHGAGVVMIGTGERKMSPATP